MLREQMEDGAKGGGSTAIVIEDSLDAGSGQAIGLEHQCIGMFGM